MFTTSEKIDYDFCMRNRAVFFRKKRMFAQVMAVALVASGTLNTALFREAYWIVIWGGMAVLLVASELASEKREIKSVIKAFQESMGQDYSIVSTVFQDNAVTMTNDTNGNSKTIRYDSIKKMYISPEIYILKSEAGMLVVVFRECLSEQDESQLIEFLKSKKIKIKWR